MMGSDTQRTAGILNLLYVRMFVYASPIPLLLLTTTTSTTATAAATAGFARHHTPPEREIERDNTGSD